MDQETPIPPIKAEAARRAKRANLPSLIWRGAEGGLGFPFILSEIVWKVSTSQNSGHC